MITITLITMGAILITIDIALITHIIHTILTK
jgi:hypothetical protein